MRETVRLEKSGRILIPVSIRRKLGLIEGMTELLLDAKDDQISIQTRSAALARARERVRKYIPPGVSLSEELLADRRREATRD